MSYSDLYFTNRRQQNYMLQKRNEVVGNSEPSMVIILGLPFSTSAASTIKKHHIDKDIVDEVLQYLPQDQVTKADLDYAKQSVKNMYY